MSTSLGFYPRYFGKSGGLLCFILIEIIKISLYNFISRFICNNFCKLFTCKNGDYFESLDSVYFL